MDGCLTMAAAALLIKRAAVFLFQDTAQYLILHESQKRDFRLP